MKTMIKHSIIPVFILCALLIYSLYFYNSAVPTLSQLTLFSLVNTIITLVILVITPKKICIVSWFFMLFLAVFHFGQAWLYYFGISVDTNISYDIFEIYHYDDIYNTMLFCLVTFNLLALFMLLFSKRQYADNQQVERDWDLSERQRILRFGVVILVILIPFVIMYDYTVISLTRSGGHKALYLYSSDYAFYSSMNAYLPLAIIMIIAGSNPKGKWWQIVLFLAISRYLFLMFSTGKRGSLVIPILLYLLCRHIFIKRYQLRQIGYFLVGGFIFISIIAFIAYSRGNNADSLLEFVSEKNIIVQILSEMGSTFVTTILAYQQTMVDGFWHGISYLGSLATFLPFSNILASTAKEYQVVGKILNPYSPSGGALGGSFFAELYINFGWWSVCLAPLFAWVLSIIDRILNSTKTHSLILSCCCLYTSYGFWLYSRGDFLDVVLSVKRVLYVLIVYWLLFCYNRKPSIKIVSDTPAQEGNTAAETQGTYCD